MITANGVPIVLSVDEPSKAGEARRFAATLAKRLGFDEQRCGNVSIAVTEVATNLCKHAKGGRLVLSALEGRRSVGLEILALDQGPGMANVGRCMTDGYSTAGSPGNGFGAMTRLSSTFDIYSLIETGTVQLLRFEQPDKRGSEAGGVEMGVVNLPLTGEEVNGDGWAIDEQPGRTVVLMVDGLGHGLAAADAALQAIGSFRKHADKSTESILRAAHEALKKTRGAALAVASLDHERREIRFAGIGNISASIWSPVESQSTSMVSHNGTVGHSLRKVQEFTYVWPAGSLLIMHSDGVATHWQLGRYPGLATRHPAVIAGVLYRDFQRARDDSTVLVVREKDGAIP